MTGVIVGRFQVPELHLGHIHLITTALKECDDVAILLGVSNVIDHRNPYSLMTRVNMIKKIFPQTVISSIQDKSSDKEWCEYLDTYLEYFKDPVLYHSRDSFKEVYTGKYPLREVKEIEGYSGTKLREQLKTDT